MKTREIFERMNSLFSKDADIYKLPLDSRLTLEQTKRAEEIISYLSDEANFETAREYIEELIIQGGIRFLTIVHEYLTNRVIPALITYRRLSENLERAEPGKWREHCEVMNNDYNNLTLNGGMLKRRLNDYSEVEKKAESPRLSI